MQETYLDKRKFIQKSMKSTLKYQNSLSIYNRFRQSCTNLQSCIELQISPFIYFSLNLKEGYFRVINGSKNNIKRVSLGQNQKDKLRMLLNQASSNKSIIERIIQILQQEQDKLIGGGCCQSCNQGNAIPELRQADTEDIEDLNNDSIIFQKNEEEKKDTEEEKNVDFQTQYEKFVDSKRISKVIADNSFSQEMFLIIEECIYKNRQVIVTNLEVFKLQVMHIFELFVNYLFSSTQFNMGNEKTISKDVNNLNNMIQAIIQYIDTLNFDYPCLDLIFMLEMLKNLNSMRTGYNILTKNELEIISTLAISITKLSIGMNTSLSFSDNNEIEIKFQNLNQIFQKIKQKTTGTNQGVKEGGQYISQYLTTNLYQYIVSLWINKYEVFQSSFLSTSLFDEIDFYITKLLQIKLPGSKNIIVFMLIKINNLLEIGLSEDSNEFTRILAEKFITTQENFYKLQTFIGVIQPKDQDVINEFKELVVQLRHPEFRFLSMQILLKLVYVMNHIDISQVETIMIHLCTQYLCETEQSVKVVFKNNTKMQNFLKKIKNNKNAKQQVRDYSLQRRKQLTVVMEVDEQNAEK